MTKDFLTPLCVSSCLQEEELCTPPMWGSFYYTIFKCPPWQLKHFIQNFFLLSFLILLQQLKFIFSNFEFNGNSQHEVIFFQGLHLLSKSMKSLVNSSLQLRNLSILFLFASFSLSTVQQVIYSIRPQPWMVHKEHGSEYVCGTTTHFALEMNL